MMNQFKVAVVGGGITGLTCAWQLRRLMPNCQILLLESQAELGGVLRTDVIDGFLVERSADMFTSDPPFAVDLVKELGRSDQLIGTLPVKDRAYLAVPPSQQHPRGLAAVPRGLSLMLPTDPQAVVQSGILDSEGIQRLLQESTIPPAIGGEDESLQDFAERRFGSQVFQRIIQPLVSGIYTADPKKLSMQATMSRFVKLEQRFGSLLTAAAAQANKQTPSTQPVIASDQSASGARYDLFRAPVNGMGQLIEWIFSDTPRLSLQLNSQVVDLAHQSQSWMVSTQSIPSARTKETQHHTFEVNAVVLATSARTSARLIGSLKGHTDTTQQLNRLARLASRLNDISFASCALVVLGFENDQIQHPFPGYGIVVPAYLNRNLIAASFSSNKFSGRAPQDATLIRCFIGGALNGGHLNLSDQELYSMALNELNDWLQIRGRPAIQRVYRWWDAMPQYHLGHLQLINQIQNEISGISGLFLAGNSYTGVGIPVCTDQGRSAAQQVARFLHDLGT